MKFQSKFIHFHSRKCIWKCRLQNAVYFVSASEEGQQRISPRGMGYLSSIDIMWMNLPNLVIMPEIFLQLHNHKLQKKCEIIIWMVCLCPYLSKLGRLAQCWVDLHNTQQPPTIEVEQVFVRQWPECMPHALNLVGWICMLCTALLGMSCGFLFLWSFSGRVQNHPSAISSQCNLNCDILFIMGEGGADWLSFCLKLTFSHNNIT